jgi:copper chaperone CopZ
VEYYIMTSKENIANKVELRIKSDKFYERKMAIGKEEAEEINEISNIYVVSKEDSFYPDIFEIPVVLVSNRLKKLINIYDDREIFKCTVITDIKRKRQEVYWLTLIDKIECVASESEFKKDKTIKKLVLDKEKIGNKKIFRIGGIVEKIIVINEDIAESILRRHFEGIGINKVESV